MTAPKPTPVRIDPDLYERLIRRAEANRRSVTQEVNAILQAAVTVTL